MSLKKVLVTGGAGFIGSNLCDRLLSEGLRVTAYDNFSTGCPEFLREARKNGRFRLVKGDVLDPARLRKALKGHDFVFHLAANADVRHGTEHPDRDLKQNTIATFNVLESARRSGIRRIAFSSTGSVYGEPKVHPTPEDAPMPVQTSLYGASKLAGEGLVQAFAEGFGMQGFIFRFVSILGERYTHGHVFDFYKKLTARPEELEILGDGMQRKSYLYVGDCVSAMLTAVDKAPGKLEIFNLGTREYCQVKDSAGWICGRLGLKPCFRYTGGTRGWIGDSPFIFLETRKIRRLGWKPSLSIRQGVLKTVDYLKANPWVMERA
jgi:UDP-glucose 4-epimerase